MLGMIGPVSLSMWSLHVDFLHHTAQVSLNTKADTSATFCGLMGVSCQPRFCSGNTEGLGEILKGVGAGRCGSGVPSLISYHTGSWLCPVTWIYGVCDGAHLKVLSRKAVQLIYALELHYPVQ